MMLFGGSLSGFKPDEKPKKEATLPPSVVEDVTPHSDLISRLTQQEQRLLDELERTRSKLTTEWKLKVQDMKANGQPMEDAPHILSESNQEDRKKRARQSSVHTPGVPHLRHSFDMLPILTNTGDTPFEVGLDMKTTTQHVLPVFKLPPVTMKSQEAIELATHRSEGASPSTLSNNAHSLQLSLSILDERIKPRKQPIKRPKWRRHHGRKSCNPSDILRSQLQDALENVQAYTTMVKNDIAEAHKFCPISSIRGDRFVKKWGVEKLYGVCTQLIYARVSSAFDRWRTVATWLKQREARVALMQSQGTRKLDLYFSNWTKRRMAAAWDKWVDIIYAEKMAHQAALELDATMILQRAWRAFTKRRLYTFIRNQQRAKRQNAAACIIQALFRGRFARNTAKKLVRDIKQARGATVIQAFIRGVLTRQSLIQAKREHNEHKAARKLQALHRGRIGRRRAAQLRRERQRQLAAIIIQRRYRGRLRNARQIRMMIERERRRQIIKIQALYRGRRGRQRVVRVKVQRAQHQIKLNKCALKIQSVYRGHRGRISTSIQLSMRRELLRQRNEAATTIQTLFRGRKAKQTVLAARVERLNQLVADSRVWSQFWSEDANAFFFYHSQTGEAIWEPPDIGYTKTDGQLVLADGSVIPDPAMAEAKQVEETKEEQEEPADAMCIECEETEATRRCFQCEDVFCDSCYERTHGTGKRAAHTWKAIGPIKCIECEKMKATRWCDQCMDPYCLGCYSIIHAKGNKAHHTWKEVSKNGKFIQEDSSTYNEFVNSMEYNYINEGIAHQEEIPVETEQMQNFYNEYEEYAEQYEEDQQAASDWIAAVDEVSGELYYYNTVTGETQWAQ
ncbi:hypothetical protein AeNC1_003806 [Aphanomyces euteiches]|nr:hypothetical protein AeNC1_003806 [Aphanomyces euteiches]